MLELIRSCFRNLSRKRLRSTLTIVGIAIGVLSVIVISTIGEIGENTVNTELNSIGIGGLFVHTDQRVTTDGLGADELSIIENDEGVQASMPVIMQYTTAQAHGIDIDSAVFGVDQSLPQIVSVDMLHGRMFSTLDTDQAARVCIVDQSFAQSLYHRDNIVGKTLQITLNDNPVDFQVIGVAASGGNIMQGMIGSYIPSFIYIPITTMQKYYNGSEYNQVMIKLDENAQSETVMSRLENNLNNSLGQNNAVIVDDMVSGQEQLNQLMDIVTMVLTIIASISLVVSGLSIMTLMLVSVHERTHEIGIKKSIGASHRRIMLEFLIESFFLCIIGSFIGIVSGLLITFIGCAILDIPFLINGAMIVFCIIFTIIIGTVFGVYPASKAARLKPVDALNMVH